MKKIEPVRSVAFNEREDFYDPYCQENGKLICCCGFELVKESEDTYRCTGGNHRYVISEGDVIMDKFGNIMLKLKEDPNKNGKTKISKKKAR